MSTGSSAPIPARCPLLFHGSGRAIVRGRCAITSRSYANARPGGRAHAFCAQRALSARSRCASTARGTARRRWTEAWTEAWRELDGQAVRTTFTYKRKPTPEQERALVVRRCRELSNAGREERRDARQTCGVTRPAARQSAQRPDLHEVRPASRDLHAPGAPEGITRLERAFQGLFGCFGCFGCFARVTSAATPAQRHQRSDTSAATAGDPRLQGAGRSSRFTYKPSDNQAV
jgi:hypothetical protein